MKTGNRLVSISLSFIGKADQVVNTTTLFVTFIAFMGWSFLAMQTVIGPKTWLWMPIGGLLVVALLTCFSILQEGWRDLSQLAWVKLLVSLVSLLRNGVAVIVMFRLAQSIYASIRSDSGLGPGEALWRIVLGG